MSKRWLLLANVPVTERPIMPHRGSASRATASASVRHFSLIEAIATKAVSVVSCHA